MTNSTDVTTTVDKTMSTDLATVPPAVLASLLDWLCKTFADDTLEVTRFRKLAGGAIQQNIALALSLDCGRVNRSLVLRTDAPSGVDVSLSRAEEHAVLVAACSAGVTVPAPVAFCKDETVLGAPFFLMERVTGTTHPVQLTRDETLDDAARSSLLSQLGVELARIHAIPLDEPSLAFLVDRAAVGKATGGACSHLQADSQTELQAVPHVVAKGVLGQRIEHYRSLLDALGQTRPVLEWVLAWLERRSIVSTPAVLCHNDFRTGNLMIDGVRLTGVLDWEFAAVGDRHEDIGWFCAPCWRFARRDRPAGGLGFREDFYRGYTSVSGSDIDAKAVEVWEIVATLRWAVIALQQGARFTSGNEATLELALTGRMIAELEQDLLDQVVAFDATIDANINADPDAIDNQSPLPDKLLRPTVDSPAALDLLGAARALMRDDIVSELPADLRYRGLMIVNALGIAHREMAQGELTQGQVLVSLDASADCSAASTANSQATVRRHFRGLGDAALRAPSLLDHLREDVDRRLSVTRPRRLDGR